MKMSLKFHRATLSVHNWVGLIIAVQFLLWCVGGVVMSVIPIELVRGEVNTAKQPIKTLTPQELASVLGKIENADLKRLTVKGIAGRATVVIEQLDGSRRLYDAASGTILMPIDQSLATQIAVGDYQHSSSSVHKAVPVISSILLTEEPGDFRRQLPVWQITLDDPDGTRIYVSPDTGDVMARRNDYWRFYDFFWMLHIMDYDTRDDFNNPLVIFASITASLFVMSGFILLYFRFWPRSKRKRN